MFEMLCYMNSNSLRSYLLFWTISIFKTTYNVSLISCIKALSLYLNKKKILCKCNLSFIGYHKQMELYSLLKVFENCCYQSIKVVVDVCTSISVIPFILWYLVKIVLTRRTSVLYSISQAAFFVLLGRNKLLDF